MLDTEPKRTALREHLESAMSLAEDLQWATVSFIIATALETVRAEEREYQPKEKPKG